MRGITAEMKLNKKSIIIIATITFVIIIAVFVVFKFVMKPGKTPPPTAAQLQAWQFSVDSITTNLGGSSIIQLQLTLQAPSSAVVAELTARAAQVDDSVISVLHNFSSQILLEPSGRKLLKKQIMDRINSYLTTGKITMVYIQKLIIQ